MAPRAFEWQTSIIKEHVLRSIEWLNDERKGIVHSRRHLANAPAFKGIDNFKPMRIALLRAESKDELFQLIDDIPNQFTVQ